MENQDYLIRWRIKNVILDGELRLLILKENQDYLIRWRIKITYFDEELRMSY